MNVGITQIIAAHKQCAIILMEIIIALVILDTLVMDLHVQVFINHFFLFTWYIFINNRCDIKEDECSTFAECNNYDAGYNCTCHSDFIRDGFTCLGISIIKRK